MTIHIRIHGWNIHRRIKIWWIDSWLHLKVRVVLLSHIVLTLIVISVVVFIHLILIVFESLILLLGIHHVHHVHVGLILILVAHSYVLASLVLKISQAQLDLGFQSKDLLPQGNLTACTNSALVHILAQYTATTSLLAFITAYVIDRWIVSETEIALGHGGSGYSIF